MTKQLCPKCHGSGNQLKTWTPWQRFVNYVKSVGTISTNHIELLEKCSVCKGSGISNDS